MSDVIKPFLMSEIDQPVRYHLSDEPNVQNLLA